MAKTYVIVDQQQTTTRDAAGNYVPAMRVTFQVTDTNTTANIVVPLSLYTPDEVARLIDAYVANIAAVHNL